MNRLHSNLSLNSVLLISLLASTIQGAQAADATEVRTRIVESSLKDLSVRNDAAIARQRIEPSREVDALGNSSVVLKPEPRIGADALVRSDVQSSLHRLRRETASRQTEDGRKARVDESLERSARDR